MLKFYPGALFGSKAGEMKQTEASRGGAFSKSVGGPTTAPEPEPAAPRLRDRPVNLGEAKELLKYFKQICSSPEFQRTINIMRQKGPTQYNVLIPGFVTRAWAETLQLFDFPATQEGYKEMLAGISKHGWNLHVKQYAHDIERLLFLPLGTTFFIAGDGDEIDYPAPTPVHEAVRSEHGTKSSRHAPPTSSVPQGQPGDIE